ncbi:WD40 repeat domain-containing protein [Desulfohalobium retbaense]|uniref:WD40 repeat, subgroup n=1 Tax=Desulfohalobium retbaense (strain ATCC 49708 / DSM 5692 / JCM 16813 / HR100) TaxID=485915 RepID=C8X5D2_DESRD|nr:WD40 repeat, subgroup [Desulfohalobium retbaense]ACV69629.1 WD40 repeat, subgroup [Desulfohalobium retbaense DSM 5692]
MARRGRRFCGLGGAAVLATLVLVGASAGLGQALTLDPLRVITAHEKNIYALAVAPDGETVYTGSRDKTIKAWSVPQGKHLATFKGHQRQVNALAASPDGTRLVSAGYDSILRLWQLPEGKQVRETRIKGAYDFDLDFDRRGRFVLVRAGRDLQLYSSPDLELQRSFDSDQGPEATVLGADGTLAVAAMTGKRLHAWDIETGALRLDSDAAPGRAAAVAASPDGRLVAWGTQAHVRSQKRSPTVWIWEPGQGETVRPLEAMTLTAQALAFTPDGKAVLAGSNRHGDGVLLAVDGSGVLATLTGREDDNLEDVAVTPDGRYALAGTKNGALVIWDLASVDTSATGAAEAAAATPVDQGGTKLEGMLLTGSLYLRFSSEGWQSMDHARELELQGEGAVLPAGVNELTGKGWPRISALVSDTVRTYADKAERVRMENRIEAEHRVRGKQEYAAGLVPLNGKETMYLRYFDGSDTVYKFFPYARGRLTTLVLTIAGRVERLPNQAKALARSAMVGPE